MLRHFRTLAAQGPREYFYYSNDHGNLYHLIRKEDILGGKEPPRGPAHMRGEKFLDFFFGMVRENKTGLHPEFPWVSKCKGELNFLLPSDRPITYTELTKDSAGKHYLTYGGGGLRALFEPEKLSVCSAGRVYYPAKIGTMGLISCHLALQLGLENIWEDDGEPPMLHWEGRKYPLQQIPAFFLET
eukprot:TRINITY_DN1510_c0_g3_i1.p1 TRINITY_DN1510_c0_g3~~TRINITY_DN1510_c0_g3_i1.p1  ORF type:complete len:186 (+),score=22.16 TRINITY_DN1510_c0_g3_i1:59-616(+)